jgi:hypothetical protein
MDTISDKALSECAIEISIPYSDTLNNGRICIR